MQLIFIRFHINLINWVNQVIIHNFHDIERRLCNLLMNYDSIIKSINYNLITFTKLNVISCSLAISGTLTKCISIH